MRLRSRIAWLAAGMVLSTVVSAYAQAQPAQPGPYPPPAPPYPRFEVSGGYQLLHAPDQTFPFGLNIDGAINTSKLFGIAGEAGWATDKVADTRVHVWNLGVGPRINGRPMGGKVWPFAQVLVGLAHVRGGGSSDNHLHVQPGGGVNFIAGDGWGVVVQGDYRRVFLDEEEFGESGQNQGRLFVGLRVLLD